MYEWLDLKKGDLVRINTINERVGSQRGFIYDFDLANQKARVVWSTGNKTIEYLRTLLRVASCEKET
jgi:hypothetical protein